MQVVLDTDRLKASAGGRIQLGTFAAMGQVDLINIAHQLQRLLFADVLIQRAAKVIGDIVLAIGESTRPAETTHDGAGGTANAGFYFIAIDGTATAAEGMSGFEYRDPQGGSPVGQLVSGKDASRASANDNDIVIHSTTSTKKNS